VASLTVKPNSQGMLYFVVRESGAGAVPAELRTAYTSKHRAQNAINTYEEGLENKAKSIKAKKKVQTKPPKQKE